MSSGRNHLEKKGKAKVGTDVEGHETVISFNFIPHRFVVMSVTCYDLSF